MQAELRFNREGVRLEAREDGEGVDTEQGPRIVGYASVFYDKSDDGTEFEIWDNAVERIMPGAFTRALKEFDDVMGLFNHDVNSVLGRTSAGTMSLEVDKRGLLYRIDPPLTERAATVVENIRRGDVDGSSFAFSVTDQEWRTEDEIDIREITGVRLFDVGPVVYPAYSATTTGFRDRDAGLVEARESCLAYRKGLQDAQKQHAAIRRTIRQYKLRALELGQKWL